MVGATEEARLNQLETQVDNGGGEAWEYLCLVRKLKARRSEKVLRHGIFILNSHIARSKLGGEEWTLYEQVAVAAMDCHRNDIANDCIEALSKKFPGSIRVGRLKGMLLEAKGAWPDAEKIYAQLLVDNPLDQIILKRKVAIAKAQGNLAAAVEYLNNYLETFMADHDAWRELAELYISIQMYKQAAFCYEELILSQPTIPLYHLAYADVLYTMGGLENLQAAKKYYASTINLTGGKNTRALYGICLSSVAINQLTKGRNKDEKDSADLQPLAAEALLKDYKERAPEKLALVTAMLRNIKLVS
ncbi:ER membrane protein complex subunit 2-A [Dendrobium catenatum]|uniref:ER membrane protein complex subunit 2 n=1 Tax=Dendrobium catenatum TaxID=906689 RepID=A0A2I0W9B2_9ASPA|nr:ER membrane protein complex subunit 2-A [Dendrobium catenatum]PKU72249.1 hypothetical protein MA16_Dca006249 [Dendrobium catenatum]